MAGNVVQEYSVEIGFAKALQNLRKIQAVSKKMSKVNEDSLSRQILLQKRLNALRKSGIIKGSTNVPTATSAPRQASPSRTRKPQTQDLASRMKTEFAVQDKKNKLFLKEQDKQKKARIKGEKEAAKTKLKVEKEWAKKRTTAVQKLTEKSGLKANQSIFADALRNEKKMANVKTKAAVSKITEKSGLKAKDTLFAQNMRDGGKVAKPKVQDAHVKARDKAMVKAAKEKVALQEKVNDVLQNERLIVGKVLTAEEKLVGESIREHTARAKSVKELKQAIRGEKRLLAENIKVTKQKKKQNFLAQRMNASSKQYASNMVSTFAIAAGVGGVTKIGQDFEATAIALTTASGSAEAGAENLKFLREQAKRLGIDYTKSAKGLSQLMAAGEGVLSQDDLRNVFLGVTEASTVMGLSADDTAGAIRAIHQMMSKSKISAEELRQQLGERMSPSFKLMAKAVGVTTEELDKMMASGKLFAKDVLPKFGKNLREFAAPGLAAALKTNRVAMNKFFNEVQFGAEAFFSGNFNKGLTELFNTLSKTLSDNKQLWTAIGDTAGATLKVIAWLIKTFVNPVLTAMGRVLGTVVDAIGDFAAAISPLFTLLIKNLIPKSLTGFGLMGKSIKGLMKFLTPIVGQFLMILGVLEEIALFFKPQEGVKTFLGTNINDIMGDLTKVSDTLNNMSAKDIALKFVVPDMLLGTKGSVIAMVAQGMYKGYTGDSTPVFGSSSQAATPITVNSNLVLDGEVIAQSVAKSSTMQSTVDRAIDSKR